MRGDATDGALARKVIIPDFTRDILESDIPRDVLAVLLADRTTDKNIMWMTDAWAAGTFRAAGVSIFLFRFPFLFKNRLRRGVEKARIRRP